MTALLEVDGLSVDFDVDDGVVTAVRELDLRLNRGTALGVVGESGCGKSVTMLAVMDLLPPNARVRGSVRFDGRPLERGTKPSWRGQRIGMVFQDSMSSLNPLMPVGRQVAEVLRYHGDLSWRLARRRAIDHLAGVGLAEPARVARQYPHELSGGMRQRVMIAGALAAEPNVLIADEATTGLDVTVQAQILDLLRELRAERGLSVIFVSHDLGAVAELCDETAVVYGGRVVETAPTRRLIAEPRHPYTQGLVASFPRLGDRHDRLQSIPGSPPTHGVDGDGCPFVPRCRRAIAACSEPVGLVAVDTDWQVACLRPGANHDT